MSIRRHRPQTGPVSRALAGASLVVLAATLAGCASTAAVDTPSAEEIAPSADPSAAQVVASPTDAESWCQHILSASGLDEALTAISGVPIPFSNALTNETGELRLVKCNTEGDAGFAISVIEWSSDVTAAAALAVLTSTVGDSVDGGSSSDAEVVPV